MDAEKVLKALADPTRRRLTVTHDRREPGSKMLHGITAGRPKFLASLKSLMETGRPLPELW